jgi:hypothetical protein
MAGLVDLAVGAAKGRTLSHISQLVSAAVFSYVQAVHAHVAPSPSLNELVERGGAGSLGLVLRGDGVRGG